MRISRDLFLLFISIVLFSQCSSAANTSFTSDAKPKLKILGVFGHPGKSHFDVFKPLVEELARRGHDVTVISYYPRSEADKAKESLPGYKDISLLSENVTAFVNVVDLKMLDHSPFMVFRELVNLRIMANIGCENGLRNTRVKEFVNSGEKFDVILTENFNTDCFLAIVHKFQAPFLALSSHAIMPWVNSRFGNPQETSYMPVIFQGLPRPMNFLEKLVNVGTTWLVTSVYEVVYHWIDQRLAEEVYGPLPDLREIARNTTAVLLNTHHTLHGSRAFLPNLIEVGGLHIPPKTKPLPEDVRMFLDDASEGVLYFNLGSMINASSMPREQLEMILRVIGSLPRKVIWKWEVDDLPHKPRNVLVRKWLPQFDILSHPNVKCYLGHGGLLGLSEGVYNGVPMVLIPMFGDQFHNAAAAKAREIAVILKYKQLEEQSLRNALDEVFNNTRYRENAQKLSKAYRDRAASPLETAVWWTEYIARGNGLPYLKSEAANLRSYQRHLYDVILFLLLVSLVSLYLFHRAAKLLFSLLFAPPISSKTKPKGPADRKRSKKED